MAAQGGTSAAPTPRTLERPIQPAWTNRRWFGRLEVMAGMGSLAAGTLRAATSPPFTWFRDCLVECSTAVRRCALPVALSSAAFMHGAGTVVTGGILGLIGAEDRLGLGLAVAADREVSAWVTGMLVAGIAGTAMCADLGARKIRDELDALKVLGLEPVRSLVVPRVVGLAIATPLLGMVSLFFAGLVGGLSSVVLLDIPLGVYVESFSAALTAPDIYALALKLFLFGLLIGVVACHKGLGVTGGPEGVGRAVNQAVVIAFGAVWALDWVYNLTFFAAFPETQSLR